MFPIKASTKAAYAALATKDPGTAYIITDAADGEVSQYLGETPTATMGGGLRDCLYAADDAAVAANADRLADGALILRASIGGATNDGGDTD